MLKTFYRFYTIADYEEEEKWLRRQHQKGWKLVRMIPPCIYTFASCEPQDVIYRLDYKNSEQSADYMQMLKDFGWEYIGDCLGWLYFRKPAAAAETEEDGELFSEDASRVEMVSKIVRTRMLPLGIIFLCCVIPNLLRAEREGWGALSIFFLIMFVIYVYLLIYCSIKLSRIRRRYSHQ
ncbi:MAG: DUF2812 domain-containing protein [Lachnospiraceae bacterium]|nr:DUF2812 domain-containing protein [Lachnospiraceae bacterium]